MHPQDRMPVSNGLFHDSQALHVDQLPTEGSLKAFIDSRPESQMAFCVGIVAGAMYAVDNICPHQSAPLSAGHINSETVACPLHGWRWSLMTGHASYAGDPDIAAFELRQYGNEVFRTHSTKNNEPLRN
jgi:nitrite reductase/ring-hydroxylating ferredoxin subunit